MMRAFFLYLVLACLFQSCSYRFGKGEMIAGYRSITIPYVAGDDDGQFTAKLIREFAESGALAISDHNGGLLLNVCLFKPSDTNIGYVRTLKKDAKEFSKKVFSSEGRVSLRAKVTLIDNCSCQTLLGPCDIKTFLDFDFEPDLSRIEQHEFSLGQMEMHPLALDAAKEPLYDLLAQKIVDYVIHSW